MHTQAVTELADLDQAQARLRDLHALRREIDHKLDLAATTTNVRTRVSLLVDLQDAWREEAQLRDGIAPPPVLAVIDANKTRRMLETIQLLKAEYAEAMARVGKTDDVADVIAFQASATAGERLTAAKARLRELLTGIPAEQPAPPVAAVLADRLDRIERHLAAGGGR